MSFPKGIGLPAKGTNRGMVKDFKLGGAVKVRRGPLDIRPGIPV